ncbi:MerR family DNA-binding transcriptional regulator [Bacillus sp. 03113]|nr:MerR family DNA-binding transcriptional regulator [Bacillus sp. 03113]
MYKISDFAEMTGLSKETLRYYAEVQLKASTNVSRRETLGNLYCGNISV